MKWFHVEFIGLFTTNLHIKLDITSYKSFSVIAITQKAKYASRGHVMKTLPPKQLCDLFSSVNYYLSFRNLINEAIFVHTSKVCIALLFTLFKGAN
jgi:hypothetical protein